MNPTRLFPNLFEQIAQGVSSNIVNEINGCNARSSEVYQDEEEFSSDPHPGRFFVPELDKQFFVPEFDIEPLASQLSEKRGFGLPDKRSFKSYIEDNPSKSINPDLLRGNVAFLVQRYDNNSTISKVSEEAEEGSEITISQKSSQKNLEKIVFESLEHNLETIEEDSQEEDLSQKELSELSKAIAFSSNNFLNDSNIRHMEASAELVFEGNDNRQESLSTTPERTKLNAVIDNNFTEISADIVFESHTHENQEPLEVTPKDRPQNEIAKEEAGGCLENFSCIRLEPLNKNCTIS